MNPLLLAAAAAEACAGTGKRVNRCLSRFREPAAASLRLLQSALPKRDPKSSRSLPAPPGCGVRRQRLTHLPAGLPSPVAERAEGRAG